MQIEAPASIDKESRLVVGNVTGSRVGPKRIGLDVVAHSAALLVASDAAEAGSTTIQIVAGSSLAKVGDFVQFTSGPLTGETVGVEAVTLAGISLSQPLSAAPSAGNTFDILRVVFYRIASDGSVVVSGTVTADAGTGFAQAVNEDDDITSATDLLPAAVKNGSGKAKPLVQPTTPADTQPVSGPLTDTQLRASAVTTVGKDEAVAWAEAGGYSYFGFAPIGTATSAAAWKVFRLGTTGKTWADSNANYDNVWNNYASLTYG